MATRAKEKRSEVSPCELGFSCAASPVNVVFFVCRVSVAACLDSQPCVAVCLSYRQPFVQVIVQFQVPVCTGLDLVSATLPYLTY